MMNSAHNPNRSLIRIFCLSLSGLLAVYAILGVTNLFQLESGNTAELAVGVLRSALALVAVGFLIRWSWFDAALERQVAMMGATFEADYSALSTKTKIRMIVLVTMLSLLLELVLIRWLASMFPVYSFYKNFTMLACFLGLGAGYAVAEKQPCAPAIVLPMLALFVGVITLLRYDTGIAYLIFSVGWLSNFDLPVYFLLGASFVICAMHLLSGRPALRQAAAQLQFAERLQPQPRGQRARGHRPVRDEPVLAAAGDLVRRDRRASCFWSCCRATNSCPWASPASACC